MSQVFSGVVFLVSPAIRPTTVAAIHAQGGSTVYALPPEGVIDCAVQPDNNSSSSGVATPTTPAASSVLLLLPATPDFCSHFSPSTVAYLRGRRIPIAYEAFIFSAVHEYHYSAGAGAVVGKDSHDRKSAKQQQQQQMNITARAMDAARGVGLAATSSPSAYRSLLAYNPFCLSGLVFTTTQLPRQMKANVIAAMVFYGAAYSPDLTADTDLVVHTRILPSPVAAAAAATAEKKKQTREQGGEGEGEEEETGAGGAGRHPTPAATKLAAATAHGIACVLPSWVQDCVKYGRLLPLSVPSPSPGPFTSPAHQQQLSQSSSNSSDGGGRGGLSPSSAGRGGGGGLSPSLASVTDEEAATATTSITAVVTVGVVATVASAAEAAPPPPPPSRGSSVGSSDSRASSPQIIFALPFSDGDSDNDEGEQRGGHRREEEGGRTNAKTHTRRRERHYSNGRKQSWRRQLTAFDASRVLSGLAGIIDKDTDISNAVPARQEEAEATAAATVGSASGGSPWFLAVPLDSSNSGCEGEKDDDGLSRVLRPDDAVEVPTTATTAAAVSCEAIHKQHQPPLPLPLPQKRRRDEAEEE